MAAHDSVDEFATRRKTDVLLRTPSGEATGTLSDLDPWGCYRIIGTGRSRFRCRPDSNEQGHPDRIRVPRGSMVSSRRTRRAAAPPGRSRRRRPWWTGR
ncbi:DUF4873 domain-containing protein [Saccharopolyspora phatthalungensis]|uniref:DUF4873 domain-containing protein n=1 Tax=Saccharopolyspora phatthalungensis TaxID=664693 RepID=UPI001619A54D|nr:DUF4873 domain-containing protein [Saccharopolyspora phatthalungensis]